MRGHMRSKLVVSGMLALALVATFAAGAHRHLATVSLRRTALDRPLPSVGDKALESGCAAWGEALATCLAEPEVTDFSFEGATKM